MKKLFFIIFLLVSGALFSQDQAFEDVKWRKMEYSNFTDQFGINDTATVVIDIFFDKRDNAATGQMTFFPITLALVFIPYTYPIGVATSAISFPLFVHGGYTLIKYRKRKLFKVLDHYKSTRELPNWLIKKVDKQLGLYKVIEREY